MTLGLYSSADETKGSGQLHSVSLELKEHDEVLAGVVSQLALDIIYDANELIPGINERHAEEMAAEEIGGDDE